MSHNMVCTSVVLFTTFRINCHPHVLIMSRKVDVQAHKEPQDEKKSKVMPLLMKVEVFVYVGPNNEHCYVRIPL
jgi:hypothetical protein